jgi:hypothetical protein
MVDLTLHASLISFLFVQQGTQSIGCDVLSELFTSGEECNIKVRNMDNILILLVQGILLTHHAGSLLQLVSMFLTDEWARTDKKQRIY